MTFPDVAGRLLRSGVERYRIDLAAALAVYYAADGTEARRVPMPGHEMRVAPEFDADAVREAILEVRRGGIDYQEFLRRVANAGTAGYDAYLAGRRVIYWGRKGDFHVEPFPDAKP